MKALDSESLCKKSCLKLKECPFLRDDVQLLVSDIVIYKKNGIKTAETLCPSVFVKLEALDYRDEVLEDYNIDAMEDYLHKCFGISKSQHSYKTCSKRWLQAVGFSNEIIVKSKKYNM